MHELGVVFYILDSVKKIAIENKAKGIRMVILEIGDVSGIIPYYLEDCWQWAIKKDEMTKDAELKIETIKAVSYCSDCKKEFDTIKNGKTCPVCKGGNTYLLTGNEVIIKEIEVF